MQTISREDFQTILVAIDPAATSGEEADDTGIVVTARGPCQPAICKLAKMGVQCPGHGYVLDDVTCHLPPHGWATVAIESFDKWRADRLVGETNNGGEMIEATIRAIRPGIPYSTVYATRGKTIRAEPVSALFEQGRGHLVGEFRELEAELTTWTQDAGWSPNRLDALVWGFTELGLIGAQGFAFLASYKREVAERAGRLPSQPTTFLPVVGIQYCKCPAGRRRFQLVGDKTVCHHCGGEKAEG